MVKMRHSEGLLKKIRMSLFYIRHMPFISVWQIHFQTVLEAARV